MPTIPGSVRVGGFIAPSLTSDPYATHEDTYGKGGFRAVANLTARDAITAERRVEGMWVKVLSEDKVYTLSGGITNGDWLEQTMGGGGAITAPLTMYVDGTAGDDANDGLAWLTAKQTFGFLMAGEADALPREINAAVVIYFRNDIPARNTQGHLHIKDFFGSGSITIEGVLTAEETFIASSYDNDFNNRYSRYWVSDATKAWTPNQWRRHFVEVATGYDPDAFYPVLSNTDTKIVIPYGRSLVGSPNCTIYSAPQILSEIVTDPGVYYEFAWGTYTVIQDNTVEITVKNLWVDERLTMDSLASERSISVTFIHAAFNTFNSCLRNLITSFQGCYFDVSNYGFVYAFGPAELQYWACVFYSSDVTGGFNCDSYVYAMFMKCYFYGLGFAMWCTGKSIIDIRFENYIESCTEAIAITDSSVNLYDLSGGIRFDACTTGLYGTGDIVYQGQDILSWDTPTEIKFGDTDIATFASLVARTLQSRVALRIAYLDASYIFEPMDEYDNTTSGLTAVRYQTAIDELAARGVINLAMFSETVIDLIDDTDFTIVEAVPYVTEGMGYMLEVTPTTGTGNLTVILYQDVARLEPIYTLVVDLSDPNTYRTVEVFGFELETTGTIYGTAFVSGVGVGETFDINLTVVGVQPSVAPAPLPSPYGDGIEDDGLGKPRVAFPSDGGLVFALGKLKIKPDTTATVYPTLAVGGVAITGAVTTTTNENISAKKLFTAIGSGRLGTAGSPVAGTYLVGHEILDSGGIKYRCTVAGTPGSWELADSVSDTEADYSTAELAPGAEEVLEILTTGNVGMLQLLQVWAVVDDVADYSTDFRLRVYRTADGFGRDVMWQASGIARQSYLTVILPAAQDFVEVNDEDMFETDEACIIYEDDNRYELARIIARSAGNMDLAETLVDASNWAADTWVCGVAEFENVPFRNTDTTPANQNRVFLEVRNNHAANSAVFYVRALPLNLGVLR